MTEFVGEFYRAKGSNLGPTGGLIGNVNSCRRTNDSFKSAYLACCVDTLLKTEFI